MTLSSSSSSSISADVHGAWCLRRGRCQVKLPQRLYMYSTLASAQIFHTVGSVAAQKMWFFQHPSKVTRSLAASVRWCSGLVAARTRPPPAAASHHISFLPGCAGIGTVVLFNTAFIRAVWHSHTFLPGWCRVVKWRVGLSFLFVCDDRGDNRCTPLALHLLPPSVLHSLHPPAFTLLGQIPAADSSHRCPGPHATWSSLGFLGEGAVSFPVLNWRHGNVSSAAWGRYSKPLQRHCHKETRARTRTHTYKHTNNVITINIISCVFSTCETRRFCFRSFPDWILHNQDLQWRTLEQKLHLRSKYLSWHNLVSQLLIINSKVKFVPYILTVTFYSEMFLIDSLYRFIIKKLLCAYRYVNS